MNDPELAGFEPNLGIVIKKKTSRPDCPVDITIHLPPVEHNWEWLEGSSSPKPGTGVKKSRRQPDMRPENTLHMSVNVRCHSRPWTPVIACDICQQRESSRAGRSNKNRESVCGGELDPNASVASTNKGMGPITSDSKGLVVFKRAPWEINQNSVNIRLRVTCYCSHHSENEGFKLVFTLRDSQRRIVGHGTSPPILIIDSRKKGHKKSDTRTRTHPLRRERGFTPERNVSTTRRVHFGVAAPGYIASAAQPSRTPEFQVSHPMNTRNDYSHPPAPDGSQTRTGHEDAVRAGADPLSRQSGFPEVPSSPTDESVTNPPQAPEPQPQPQIQVVIPSSGPLSGGIEVTVLGTNFDPSHICVFGEVAATTTWWNSGALRCIVPPSAVPGPVVITVQGYPLFVGGGPVTDPPVWFKYEDTRENDMIGFLFGIVAQLIQGPEGGPAAVPHSNMSNPLWFPTLPGGQDGETSFQHALRLRTADPENSALGLLKLLDWDSDHTGMAPTEALSLPSNSGLTLLHLSASLGFNRLVRDLVARKVALHRQDNNGNTPLHLAALYGQQACAQILAENGADGAIVDIQGCTPREVALQYNHSDIADILGRGTAELSSSDADVPSNFNTETSCPSPSSKLSIISFLKTTFKELVRSKKNGSGEATSPMLEPRSPPASSTVKEIRSDNDTSGVSTPTTNFPSPMSLLSALSEDTSEPHQETVPASRSYPEHSHTIQQAPAAPGRCAGHECVDSCDLPPVVSPTRLASQAEGTKTLTQSGTESTPNGLGLLGGESRISLITALSTTSSTAVASSAASSSTAIASPVVFPALSAVSKGILRLTLPELCDFMTKHKLLQRAEIASTQVYAERRPGLDYLFLVCELHLDDLETLYLRLDGRRRRKLSRGTSSESEGAASNHTALLSTTKESLIRKCTAENRQTFGSAPTLGDLQHFLFSACDQTIANEGHIPYDWFIVSLLQHHLQESGDGTIVEGQMRPLKPATLNRIRETLRLLNNMPAPFSLTELLYSLKRCSKNYPKLMQSSLSETLKLSSDWDLAPDRDAARGLALAHKLARSSKSLAKQLDAVAHVVEIRLLLEESAKLLRVLYKHDTQLYKEPLSRTLYHLGAHLCSAGYWERAEESLREATSLHRQLYSADASEHNGACLALMLHEYAESLEKLERKDEAQQVISEALVLRRKLFGTRCGPTSEIPAYVRSYGDYLFLDKSLLSDSE